MLHEITTMKTKLKIEPKTSSEIRMNFLFVRRRTDDEDHFFLARLKIVIKTINLLSLLATHNSQKEAFLKYIGNTQTVAIPPSQ